VKHANVYNYLDFRKYLEDYQAARQATDKSFTKAFVCAKMGMPNNRGYFQNVIAGRKEVTKTFIERFIWVLELDEDESQYFRVLVQFNQSTIERERSLLFDQLIALNHTPQSVVDPAAYDYYKKWYPSAIRALLDVDDFKDDHAALARRLAPPITAKEAREAMELLRKLGLITPDAHGFWKPTDKVLNAGPYVQSELIKRYQLECLELAKKVVLIRTGEKKNISTMTLSMSKDIRDKIEQKLQKFKSEVNAMVHKDDKRAECVYQLNLQFFTCLGGGAAE
jgi:uncharacterized protein (TIGR02147 family)